MENIRAESANPLKVYWNNLPDRLRFPASVWAAASILLWGWLAVLLNLGLVDPQGFTGSLPAWLEAWRRNDTLFYLDIAQIGYGNSELSLFYPLYPFLARWVHLLTGLPEIAAMLLLSSLFALACLLMIYRLAEPVGGAAFAQRAVLAAAFFPASFYFWTGYPQSLLLMLILAAWLLARQGKWLLACLAALAAGLAHSTALMVVFPLLVIGFQEIRKRRGLLRWSLLLPAIFPALGMGVFWSWRLFAGFESYHHLELVLYHRIIQWPWQTFLQAFQQAFDPTYPQMMPRVNLVVMLTVFAALIWSWRKLPFEYLVFLAAGLGLGLTASSKVEPLWSYTRFSISLFPIFFVFSAWMERRVERLILTVVLLMGWLFLSALLFIGAWVA